MTSVTGGTGGIDRDQSGILPKPRMSNRQKIESQQIISDILKDGTIDSNEKMKLHDLGRDFSDVDLSSLKDYDGEPLSSQVTDLFKIGSETSTRIRDRKNIITTQTTGASTEERNLKIGVKLSGSPTKIQSIGEDQAADCYTRMSADQLNCVSDSLSIIGRNSGKVWDIPNGSQQVTAKNLMSWTGSSWDAMNLGNYKNSEDVRNALQGQEGKALVVDGGHTYVYMGMTEQGKALVKDPSSLEGSPLRELGFDGTSVSVYVQGSGDRNLTGEISANEKIVKPFGQVERLEGDSDETFNMRKLMTFMSDPSQSEKFDEFKGLINQASQNGFTARDITIVSDFISNIGIDLDKLEIRAMCNVLTQPVESQEGQTNLLNLFDDLNNRSVDGALTSDQTNFTTGIQYSRISLDNWFSNTSSAVTKAQNMYNVSNALMNAEDGC